MDYYNGKIHEKLADENRAASKKYLQQIRQSSRHCHPPLEPPSMLHRTHSGAQKRIRQRQEQLWQRTASSPSPSPSVDQPEVHKGCTTYRSLVESCAYRSILPENCEEDVPVVSHSRPISSAPITHSTSLTSLNSIPGTSFADITSNAIPVTTEKPMVEVRPLLVTPQQCNGQPYMSRQLVDRGHRDGEKPLVPKKPQRLISQNAKPLCCSPTLSRSTPHLNVDLNSSNDHISRLYCTPSLWGLHKEMSLPNHSNQDMIRIEAKRQELIESLSRKIGQLEINEQSLEEDLKNANAYKELVFNALRNLGASQLVEKGEENLRQNLQLVRLETRLRCQKERYKALSVIGDVAERDDYSQRLLRTEQQIKDQSELRRAFDRRDMMVDIEITEALHNDSLAAEWKYFKKTWSDLVRSKKESEERLALARDQRSALQNFQPHL